MHEMRVLLRQLGEILSKTTGGGRRRRVVPPHEGCKAEMRIDSEGVDVYCHPMKGGRQRWE